MNRPESIYEFFLFGMAMLNLLMLWWSRHAR